jgi:hypothetical protein
MPALIDVCFNLIEAAFGKFSTEFVQLVQHTSLGPSAGRIDLMWNQVNVRFAMLRQCHGLPGSLYALGNLGQIGFGFKKSDFFHGHILLVGSTSLSDNNNASKWELFQVDQS